MFDFFDKNIFDLNDDGETDIFEMAFAFGTLFDDDDEEDDDRSYELDFLDDDEFDLM